MWTMFRLSGFGLRRRSRSPHRSHLGVSGSIGCRFWASFMTGPTFVRADFGPHNFGSSENQGVPKAGYAPRGKNVKTHVRAVVCVVILRFCSTCAIELREVVCRPSPFAVHLCQDLAHFSAVSAEAKRRAIVCGQGVVKWFVDVCSPANDRCGNESSKRGPRFRWFRFGRFCLGSLGSGNPVCLEP